jgi:glutamate synthase (NADPH/NADH) large chain
MPVYNRDIHKDNCGFGLIAHIDGEPSHRLVRTAIGALDRMDHRGAIGADGKTGDGCGLLLQKPDAFFQAIAEEQGWNLGSRYGVGMVFLGHGPERVQRVKKVFKEELATETMSCAGWR